VERAILPNRYVPALLVATDENGGVLTSTTKVCILQVSQNQVIFKAMSKRINIVLADRTLAVLDRVAARGNRSQFISRAVMHFIESQGQEMLRQRLKREAIANAERDLAMAAEWFPLEEEASAVPAQAPVKKRAKTPRTKIA
jgi:CopG family transcriptional regulator/antitoxin EndoAI